MHTHHQLMQLFDSCFFAEFNTRLVAGGEEPIYLPADSHCSVNRIIFSHDYFSSALHEVAHWCIAGVQRRALADYGYWYAPDGRDASQQRTFERVEIKPQALEWLFNRAAGSQFRLSSDNLTAGLGVSKQFADNVQNQARMFCTLGVNPRAARFIAALQDFYATDSVYVADRYSLEELLR